MLASLQSPLVISIAAGLLLLVLMYVCRSYSHKIIYRAVRALHSLLRLSARACLRSEQLVKEKNYKIIKVLAESLKERQLERRFMRIEQLVERDLNNYQMLSANINQHLADLDKDYQASAAVPEVPMEWVAAVEAVATLKEDQRNSSAVSKILENMHLTIKQHHKDLLREHRWTISSRHKILNGLQPTWRKLEKKLLQIDGNIAILRRSLRQADQHMEQFESLTSDSSQGVLASMLMRGIAALCFVVVGVIVGWANWQLLQQPLSQVLTQGRLGGLPLSSWVTSMHLAFTMVAATVLFDSLRVTQYFPLMAAMDSRGRRVLITLSGLMLVSLMVIEVVVISAAPEALGLVVNTLSQSVLLGVSVLIPVALALIIIPLEYLLNVVRPVLGGGLQILLHVSALLLRLLGSGLLQLGKITVHLYDLIIFIPLIAENQWRQKYDQEHDVAEITESLTVQEASDNNYSDMSSVNVTALRFGENQKQSKD
jgi:hypothetical protein